MTDTRPGGAHALHLSNSQIPLTQAFKHKNANIYKCFHTLINIYNFLQAGPYTGSDYVYLYTCIHTQTHVPAHMAHSISF